MKRWFMATERKNRRSEGGGHHALRDSTPGIETRPGRDRHDLEGFSPGIEITGRRGQIGAVVSRRERIESGVSYSLRKKN